MENHASVTGQQKLFFSYMAAVAVATFWDIQLKIRRLPIFYMLFQLMLTKFFNSKLFSCLAKVDHVTTVMQGAYWNKNNLIIQKNVKKKRVCKMGNVQDFWHFCFWLCDPGHSAMSSLFVNINIILYKLSQTITVLQKKTII